MTDAPSLAPSSLPPPSRRERAAWCLFDFANSAFNTLVVTFVYAAKDQERNSAAVLKTFLEEKRA